ncbi:Fe-S oxidoreductase [Peribacillus cavernae]|uniref:Fe-S oxidoreductase n=1 Tax=Peribacillus cavernae TaxID=1674310 RepID=A0A433HUP9_9BACI|nr:CC/Se motif family (seleno)protein [Peribacillus cavernae]MDQ0219986.1 hypothetical protein [Peribacillus cavernae]RUQ32051.1 Fe-S oxidoreductase [Peribacillus cavernae]
MNFELEDKAKKWIESKGKPLTVKTLEVKGCCAVGLQELLAVPGKPKALNRFNEFKVDSISIYVEKNINVKENITLKLSGFGFLKSISAKASLQ